jgi:hypothetical protein
VGSFRNLVALALNQRRPSGPGEKLVEMAESSSDKYAYENKIAERFGGQKELELVVPTPSGIPSPEMKEAAN